MIAQEACRVAHLGGPRGDRLSLTDGDQIFARVADLGWDQKAQCTPQRRLLLTDRSLFVLEPAGGLFLAPPLRVRRFDWDGQEQESLEQEAQAVGRDLFFQARRQPDGCVRFLHCGIDPVTGRPSSWAQAVPTELVRQAAWGAPVKAGECWWYSVRGAGLVRMKEGRARSWPGSPGPVQRIGDQVVCVGSTGLWQDGIWRRLAGRPLFPRWNAPLSAQVAPWGDHGLVVLRREGGRLPVLDAPAARLPAGIYTALVPLPAGVYALAEEQPPRLVRVEF